MSPSRKRRRPRGSTTLRQSVARILRDAVGPRFDDLTPERRSEIARRFIEAGSRAVREPTERPHDIARLMDSAKRALGVARHQLALATTPGHPPVLIAPDWRVLQAVADRERARLLAIDGVVGLGLGYRRRDDRVDEDERCVVVFVRRKFTPATLRKRGARKIPLTLRSPRGTRVPVDVVEFGRIVRQARGGDPLGPADVRSMGTIGSFGVDLATREPVALTAMHVTERTEFPPGPPVPMVSPSAVQSDPRPLGVLLRGTTRDVDAAAVRVIAPGTITREIPGVGVVRGWRPVSHPGDRGTAVQMRGARTDRVVFGRVIETNVSLPEEGLSNALLVQIDSDDGDSGAAIVDNQSLVLGLLVGVSSRFDGLRVFSPIASVLAALRCDIPPIPEA